MYLSGEGDMMLTLEERGYRLTMGRRLLSKDADLAA